MSNGSALCIECDERPRYGTYQRCWACHCADNAKRTCVECGKPRWKAHRRCREHQLALRNVRQRERYASDESHRITVREQQRRWVADHPEFRKRRQMAVSKRTRERYATDPVYRRKTRDYANGRRYGLSASEYRELIARGCEACGSFTDLHIDHDHACCPGKESCGKCVRGTLCGPCNWALGLLGDSEERCVALVNYLRSRRPSRTGVEPEVSS